MYATKTDLALTMYATNTDLAILQESTKFLKREPIIEVLVNQIFYQQKQQLEFCSALIGQ